MTRTEMVARMSEISAEVSRLAAHEHRTKAQEQRFNALTEEFKDLEMRCVSQDLRSGGGPYRLEGGSTAASDYAPDVAPRGTSAVRAAALDVLEHSERGHLTRGVLDTVARAVERDDSDAMSKYVAVAGSPEYLRAFHKIMANPTMGSHEWTEQERAAFGRTQQLQRAMSTVDAAGGFLVPFELDPSIVLSSAGTSNTSLRSAFTVKTIATDAWHGVTSAGVTAEWAAEAAEVADASPTLAEATIPVHRGDAFIPFSFEIGMDTPNFAGEMARLLSDAKERLEATAFITGTGTGQPTGLVTAAVAASKTVNSATADTYAIADVYALKKALPARWRAGAAWLANEDVWDLTRQFSTGTGPQSAFWTDLAGDTPSRLLGRPVYESSEMDGTVTASTTNYLLVYGDLKQMVVVDRVGSQVELVPHLFGPAGRRPTGQRGLILWWRTGASLVVPDAVRVLNA
jgi:HK97 family phage major capsid protein